MAELQYTMIAAAFVAGLATGVPAVVVLWVMRRRLSRAFEDAD